MIKKISASRIGVILVSMFFAFIFIVAMPTNKAQAALVLDSATTALLGETISATGNLINTVQVKINQDAFTPAQSNAVSITIGGISSILANISSIIGGISFPATGYAPYWDI